MSKANFFLKKPASTGLSLIYLQFQWDEKRFRYSTGQNIHPKLWDKDRQRVKNNAMATKDGKHYINDLLRNMEDVANAGYNKECAKGPSPSIEQVRSYLDKFFNKNQDEPETPPVQQKKTLYDLIDKFLDNKILYHGQLKSLATLKTYRTTLGHLKAFEKTDGPIDFDTITLEWFYRFITFLRMGGLKANSLAKNIGVLKVFMSEGLELGYHSNLAFKMKRFSVSQELVETAYLTNAEIITIANCDVSQNPNLEHVRDAFVIACLTGLRYSDLSTLRPEHIQRINGQLYIRKTTLKTKEEVIVPIDDKVQEILNCYKAKGMTLPRVASNPVFNKQIKLVLRIAGLVEKGRLASDPERPLFECVSSHTGRRTFATNAYLDGVAVLDIMRMTGHKTEKAFLRYVRLSRFHAAQRFSEHYKKIEGSHLKKAI